MRMYVPILFILYGQAQIPAQSPDLYQLYQKRHAKIKICKPEYDWISSQTNHLNSRSIFDSLIYTSLHLELLSHCLSLLRKFRGLLVFALEVSNTQADHLSVQPGRCGFPCAKIIQIITKNSCFSLLPMSGLFSKISILIGQL